MQERKKKGGTAYLDNLVNAQRPVQLSKLTFICATQERQELLKQGLLIVASFRSGGWDEHLIQGTRNTLPEEPKKWCTTGTCREFLRGRGSNVKKGYIRANFTTLSTLLL